ncbi:MAG: putative methyltransferase [Ilumatobacteraceae bacterium]|nr:putative methyltransferase [Ilumatobacteraceae bacterium]
MPGADSHYFDEEPTVASAPVGVELWLPDFQLTLTTDRGVFGHDRIDAGTKLLLLRAPAPAATGSLLDIGCGAGAIALTMAKRSPAATVWAIDVNARARALCADNAAANGLDNVRVVAPDDVPADEGFATIWSNPPIRIGKPALHELLGRWLPRLTRDGEAVLVVHKHLGADSLQRWLTGELHLPTTRAASSSGYRILHIAAPSA